MPRDGSGTYTLPAGNPVVTGTSISSTVQNTTMADVASALTGSLSADGQTPVVADIPFSGFKATDLGDGTSSTDAVTIGQLATGDDPMEGAARVHFGGDQAYSAGSVGARLMERINVCDAPFNAVGDGSTDDGPAIRDALAEAGTRRQVYAPGGKIFAVSPAVGQTTAITISDNQHFVCDGELRPGANNTAVIRITGSRATVEVNKFGNPSSYTGCSALRFAPTDETDTTTLVNINYNRVSFEQILNYTEGIVFRPGPEVGGTDSGMFYNRVVGGDILAVKCIWFKDVPNSGASGANRNKMIGIRCGGSGVANGVVIDAGNTNRFIACDFEGITTAPGKAVDIASGGTGPGAGTEYNQFIACWWESNTVDLDNDTLATQLIGSAPLTVTGSASPGITFGQTYGGTSPLLTIDGVVSGTQLVATGGAVRLVSSNTPASASATGVQGNVVWDSNYIYVCTATNTWKRAAISTW